MKIQKTIIISTAIFLIALSIRLIAVFNYNTPLGADEAAYDSIARELLINKRFYIESSYSRPPAYPFLLSIIYFISGYKLIAIRIIQAIMDSMMCLLIYRLCSKLFSQAVALTASAMSIGYALFINSASRFLTESFCTFTFFLIIFYVYKTKEAMNYRNMVIIGAMASLLALTKGMALLFLPFLLLCLLIIRYYHPLPYKEFFKKAGVAMLAFIIPIAVWTCRNYRVYHAFVPISTQGGYALYDSYFPKDGKIFGVNILDDTVLYALSFNSEVKMSRYLAGKTLEFIREHPFKILRLEVLKVLYFWTPFDWEIMGDVKGVYNFQYAFFLPFSLWGMFLLARQIYKYGPLYIPIIYIFLMCLLFYGSPRFRMPAEPYLIIFFGVGIVRFFKLFNKKYIPLAICLFYGFLNFVLYLNSGCIKYFIRDGFRSIGLW